MKTKVYVNLVICLSMTIAFVTKWTVDNFGFAGTDAFIYTLTAPVDGFDFSYVLSYLKRYHAYYIIFEILWFTLFRFYKDLKLNKLLIIFVTLLLPLSLIYFNDNYNFISYFKNQLHKTDIFTSDKYNPPLYVDPETVKVTGEDTNNLLYIYLESIECSFMDKENGGYSEYNYMPELTKLAKENISFSNTDLLGGPVNSIGSTWTIGSMVSQMSGIPLKKVLGNNVSLSDSFMPNAYMLGDILEEHDYIQEYLVGENSTFGGNNKLFMDHGNFNVYDLDDILENYEINEDSKCGWGVLDHVLLDVAKDRLSYISDEAKKENKKFTYVIETIDCHNPNGYKCKYCQNEYEDDYFNIIACQSRQIAEFIDWCKTQDWYKNTTIVIVGDHPSMASSHLKYIDENYARPTYNCFINSKVITNNYKNRKFFRLDFYPTVLSSLGFEVENDKLGLGTNLFSSTKTNAEIYGEDFINSELEKSYPNFENYIYKNSKD